MTELGNRKSWLMAISFQLCGREISIQAEGRLFEKHAMAPSAASKALLACGRVAAEADDVAIGILDIEVFGAPGGSRERLDDRCTVGDALSVERFDAVDARCGVEMLVIAPVPALRLVLGRFLQVKLHSVQMTDSVEPSHGSPNVKPNFW